MQKVRIEHEIAHPGSRSAGPYVLESFLATSEVFSHFWTTGATFIGEEVALPATNVNPTSVYSLGAVFSVHLGTSPIAPFHLAPAFLRPKPDSTTASDLVACTNPQFRDWVTSFRTFLGREPGRIIIRLFCGEALRFCQALAEYRVTGPPAVSVVPEEPHGVCTGFVTCPL
ncbi:hypothetical protein BDM02DRAFT_2691171 [Thelephora ganbajun]|uniref:Uncharacterized protein n=1 Tax=Thelephora ganbajun TaxID=370292 RepID=A0ACB6ZCH2_THEGA|nr:hypothetical protein BDM02DRAFT_2691171 [Thelephora ganbajun]